MVLPRYRWIWRSLTTIWKSVLWRDHHKDAPMEVPQARLWHRSLLPAPYPGRQKQPWEGGREDSQLQDFLTPCAFSRGLFLNGQRIWSHLRISRIGLPCLPSFKGGRFQHSRRRWTGSLLWQSVQLVAMDWLIDSSAAAVPASSMAERSPQASIFISAASFFPLYHTAYPKSKPRTVPARGLSFISRSSQISPPGRDTRGSGNPAAGILPHRHNRRQCSGSR